MKNIISLCFLLSIGICWSFHSTFLVGAELLSQTKSDDLGQSGFCKNRRDGNYKNPEDCKTYYRCLDGRKKLKRCSNGHEFNSRLRKCSSSDTANCKVRTTTTTASSTVPTRTTTASSTAPPTTASSTVPTSTTTDATSSTTTETPTKNCVIDDPTGRPPNFPSGIEVKCKEFKNWAGQIRVENVWSAYPKTGEDVLNIANWARDNSHQLRASGSMHSWAPLTTYNSNEPFASQSDSTSGLGRVVLVKTKNLTDMKVTTHIKGKIEAGQFWAQPGILSEDLLSKLEINGLTLSTYPAVGGVTLGGVLAIGGHGAELPALDETKPNGYTYGSVSSLIVSLDAIVYDREENKYVLKTFHRSNPETKAFLVNLGRSFITNVTMMASPLTTLRCISYTDIEAQELFEYDEQEPSSSNRRTFSSFLDYCGRVETILFPFTSRPWLKIWKVLDRPLRSPGWNQQVSRHVDEPYNYFFTDRFPKKITDEVERILIRNETIAAKGLGLLMYEYVKDSLFSTATKDIWGYSKNVKLYLRATTLRYTANGYAVLTSRQNVQRALNTVYTFYNKRLNEYADAGKFPINGPIEIRATGVDDPSDVDVPNAECPAIAASLPDPDKPEFDTVIWFNILTFPRTAYSEEFFMEFEQYLYSVFDGDWATIRVEWSKGWAYERNATWKSEFLLGQRRVQKVFPDWDFVANTLDKYDPFKLFTNSFITNLFEPASQ